MKKRDSILLLVIIVILVVTSVYFSSRNKTIKIGYISTLTGSKSDIGISIQNGVEVAIQEINENGGIKGKLIELILYDIEGNINKIPEAYDKMIHENVTAVIGFELSEHAVAALPIIEQYKLITIGAGCASDKINGLDDYFIRLHLSNKSQASQLANYIISKTNIKNMDVILDSSNASFTENYYAVFKSVIEELGGNIIEVIKYNDNNIKYSDIVQAIYDSDSEGILIIANGLNSGILVQHIRHQKLNKPIFGTAWGITQELINYGGESVEGMQLLVADNIESQNEKYLNFKKKINDKLNINPNSGMIKGYEAVYYLCNGIENAKNLTSLSIKNSLLENNIVHGLIKDYEIDMYGDPINTTWIVEVNNGEFKVIHEN